MSLSRREFLSRSLTAAAVAAMPQAVMGAAEPPHVRDAGGGLVDVQVADVARPKSAGDVQQSLQRWKGQVCIGGARYSMGGQIAAPGSLHLDMRGLNKVIAFDPALRVIRVQAGMRWRDVQDAIDPHDLSVRIM